MRDDDERIDAVIEARRQENEEALERVQDRYERSLGWGVD